MFAFTKASLAALVLASVSRATITIKPFTIVGNATNTISWSSSDLDRDVPVFTIELINPIFNSQFALANNVQTASNSISFSLPAVLPGPNYQIQFVDIGNINNIAAKSNDFAIAEHDATDPLPSGPPAASGVKLSSTAVPSSTSASIPATVTQSSPSTIAPGASAPRPSATTPSSASAASPSGSAASGAASSSSPSPSPSNSAAMGLVPTGSLAALIAGLLALAF